MWLELPWIDALRWVRCPACRDRIGVQRIRERFVCPHCRASLHAAPVRALLAAMSVGGALVLIVALWLAAQTPSAGTMVVMLLVGMGTSLALACVAWRTALRLHNHP